MRHMIYANDSPWIEEGDLVVSTADPLRSYWTATAEISPWERTVTTSRSLTEIIEELAHRVDYLEHTIGEMTRLLNELGIVDVSDLI